MSCQILIDCSYSLFFRKEHIEKPENEGEKRESLIILEKVGLYEGLLNKLCTEKMVRTLTKPSFDYFTSLFAVFLISIMFRRVSLEIAKMSSAAKHCNYNSNIGFLIYLFSFGVNTK